MHSRMAAITCLSFASLALAQNPNVLTPCEAAEGFELQFDGTDIASFRKNFTDYVKGSTTNTDLNQAWVVNAPVFAIGTNGQTNDVRSLKVYKDFDWRLEYRNDQNQGLVYRFRTTHDYLYKTGVEYAINNSTTTAPDVSTGAAYDIYPNALRNHYSYASAKYNEVRIVAIKDSVEHWLNGVKVLGYKYHSADFWKRVDDSKWAGVKEYTQNIPGDRSSGYIAEGYIGFQGDHGGKWSLRRMRINSNPATVAFGAPKTANCGVPNFTPSPAGSSRSRMKVERVETARLHVRFDGVDPTSLSLLTLDGREVPARVNMGWDGSATLSGWEKPGIHLLRAQFEGQSAESRMVVLP